MARKTGALRGSGVGQMLVDLSSVVGLAQAESKIATEISNNNRINSLVLGQLISKILALSSMFFSIFSDPILELFDHRVVIELLLVPGSLNFCFALIEAHRVHTVKENFHNYHGKSPDK